MLQAMNERFGELIRSARLRNHWKGRELAARLDVDAATVSRIEKGNFKDTPSPELLNRISEVLDIPRGELLQSLGYSDIREDAPAYDELSASIARATATWTPRQKRLLWQYVESVSVALDERDRIAEEPESESA